MRPNVDRSTPDRFDYIHWDSEIDRNWLGIVRFVCDGVYVSDVSITSANSAGTANCNRNTNFCWSFFCWKCRDSGELPLKNDDVLLKNGRLFCNSRQHWRDSPRQHPEHAGWACDFLLFCNCDSTVLRLILVCCIFRQVSMSVSGMMRWQTRQV